jgi:hypothetical protein
MANLRSQRLRFWQPANGHDQEATQKNPKNVAFDIALSISRTAPETDQKPPKKPAPEPPTNPFATTM